MPSADAQTFATFVVAPSNRFAHAAAVGVAESPARGFILLIIWGPRGVGKTHLLHAIGHHAQQLHASLSQRYVAAGDRQAWDIGELVDPDVLLFDDMHLIGSSFDGLRRLLLERHRRNLQTVLMSGEAPRSIDGFADFFHPRFELGLICDIGEHDEDLTRRIGVLRERARAGRSA